MYILHIETSTPVCSIALSYHDEVLAVEDHREGMNHTAILAPAIERLVQQADVPMARLDAVSVSSGPGSYTGLRVGSSTAKAIAYTIGKPIIAVPTLMALADAAFREYADVRYALPMIDARRREVYATLYDRTLKEVMPLSSIILDEAFFQERLNLYDQVICVGDGSGKIGPLADLARGLRVDTGIVCSASNLVALAVDRFRQGLTEDPLHFVPYYMKPPNITEPKRV